MDSNPTFEIPVWVSDDTQKWLSGLSKRTTCDDVIYAILYNENRHETEQNQSYAIFERWKGIEKSLQGRTKILKVWRHWGSEQTNVQFVMRRIDGMMSSGEYLATRRRYRKWRLRRRHERCLNEQSGCKGRCESGWLKDRCESGGLKGRCESGWLKGRCESGWLKGRCESGGLKRRCESGWLQNQGTLLNGRCPACRYGCPGVGVVKSVDGFNPEKMCRLQKLVKRVMNQEKKLKSTAHRLEETELLIGNFEAKIHFHRTRKKGVNYVQRSLLHDTSTSTSEDSLEDFISRENIDLLKEYVEVSDRLIYTWESLINEETIISNLMSLIRQHGTEPCTGVDGCDKHSGIIDGHRLGSENNLKGDVSLVAPVSVVEGNAANPDIDEINIELNRVMSVSVIQRITSEQLDMEMKKYENQLKAKEALIASLEEELTRKEDDEQTAENIQREPDKGPQPETRVNNSKTGQIDSQNEKEPNTESLSNDTIRSERLHNSDSVKLTNSGHFENAFSTRNSLKINLPLISSPQNTFTDNQPEGAFKETVHKSPDVSCGLTGVISAAENINREPEKGSQSETRVINSITEQIDSQNIKEPNTNSLSNDSLTLERLHNRDSAKLTNDFVDFSTRNSPKNYLPLISSTQNGFTNNQPEGAFTDGVRKKVKVSCGSTGVISTDRTEQEGTGCIDLWIGAEKEEDLSKAYHVQEEWKAVRRKHKEGPEMQGRIAVIQTLGKTTDDYSGGKSLDVNKNNDHDDDNNNNNNNNDNDDDDDENKSSSNNNNNKNNHNNNNNNIDNNNNNNNNNNNINNEQFPLHPKGPRVGIAGGTPRSEFVRTRTKRNWLSVVPPTKSNLQERVTSSSYPLQGHAPTPYPAKNEDLDQKIQTNPPPCPLIHQHPISAAIQDRTLVASFSSTSSLLDDSTTLLAPSNPCESCPFSKFDKSDDTDSTSDTGLGSMNSDEGSNTHVETLV